eukprot:NODE_919_length_1375_cov_110.183258_g764_i0.p1 GENE.NODE_919_length_1375_cov_110.183258_g764_i0~~NODE_919_length_1375_cov_110.183258_g764_i0.p1  ORF type:complete len:272 (+),score=32.04 NODE_919_length_1375_cov_110.183258_g764_i0:339-1154(+)
MKPGPTAHSSGPGQNYVYVETPERLILYVLRLIDRLGDGRPGVYLVFRPTDSLRNWVTNADMVLVASSRGQVHNGFRSLWDSGSEAVRRALEGLLKDGDTIYSCGMSLGGATCVFGAVACKEWWPSRSVECISLGSPRVGGTSFVNIPTWRYVNPGDPVPKAPPLGALLRSYPEGGENGFSWKHISPAITTNDSETLFGSQEWAKLVAGRRPSAHGFYLGIFSSTSDGTASILLQGFCDAVRKPVLHVDHRLLHSGIHSGQHAVGDGSISP